MFYHVDILRSIFCLSIFCHFDILPIRYFAFDILRLRYLAFRYLTFSIFCDSIFGNSIFCNFDILSHRYFAHSIFCDFDILSFDILLSIFCDSIFCDSIFCPGSLLLTKRYIQLVAPRSVVLNDTRGVKIEHRTLDTLRQSSIPGVVSRLVSAPMNIFSHRETTLPMEILGHRLLQR